MPSDVIPDGVLSDRDVRSAQAVLDAWLEDCHEDLRGGLEAVLTPRELLKLRGILAVQLADVRAAGVLEGHRAGLAEGAQRSLELLRDALVGEGWVSHL